MPNVAPAPLLVRRACRAVALLLIGAALAGAMSASRAESDSRWTFVTDFAATSTWPAGRISLDLGNIRRRGSHIEVWESTSFAASARAAAGGGSRYGLPETRTLWAIRCRRGTLAVVTSSATGAFPPREERLQFRTPAPGSAAAEVVARACAVVPSVDADSEPAGRRRLEIPPVLIDADADEQDER